MGKPIVQSEGEVAKCISQLDYYINNAQGFMEAEELRLAQQGVTGTIVHQPLGPILTIVPWNFPFWLPFKSAIPPLVLGNSIMLKQSPSTPLCGIALAEAFEEAGFVDGEYQNMLVSENQCKTIIADKRVRACKFTGSTRGGKAVAMECAQHVKKACLELGGNDPFVVLKDADLEKAVESAYISRMVNSAQACNNAKRFIISATVYDEFRDRLVEKIKSTAVVGDPMDRNTNIGPLASMKQKEILVEQCARAVNEGGAEITYGSPYFTHKDPALKDGAFFAPVVMENMSSDSEVYHEEFFGPVFNLFRVDSSKEAMDLANKSDYGLSGAVFTNDLVKAEACAQRLRVGNAFINTHTAIGSDHPSGGIKNSGYGRECYSDGLLDIGNRKTIIRKPE